MPPPPPPAQGVWPPAGSCCLEEAFLAPGGCGWSPWRHIRAFGGLGRHTCYCPESPLACVSRSHRPCVGKVWLTACHALSRRHLFAPPAWLETVPQAQLRFTRLESAALCGDLRAAWAMAVTFHDSGSVWQTLGRGGQTDQLN